MSVQIDVAYEGDSQCSAVHAQSGQKLVTDMPAEVSGSKNRGFSSSDLVAVGLGSCLLTTMAMVAERKGASLAGARAHVDKDLVLERPARIARMAVRLSLPASLKPELRAVLEQVAQHCLVKNSLAEAVKIEVKFEYA